MYCLLSPDRGLCKSLTRCQEEPDKAAKMRSKVCSLYLYQHLCNSIKCKLQINNTVQLVHLYLYLNYLQFAFSKSLRCQRQDKATKSDPSPILLTIVNILKVTKDQSKGRQWLKQYISHLPPKDCIPCLLICISCIDHSSILDS